MLAARKVKHHLNRLQSQILSLRKAYVMVEEVPTTKRAERHLKKHPGYNDTPENWESSDTIKAYQEKL